MINKSERDHRRCREALAAISSPMITTWPVLTEAMYLLGALGGWPGQHALWRLVEIAELKIVDINPPFAPSLRALMEKYKDVPMDLADATLVAVANAEGRQRIFTLDSDFRIYRYRGREAFEVIP